MRTDLNMSRGKMCAQAGHATTLAMMSSDPEDVIDWIENNNQTKIVLAVDDAQLTNIIAWATNRGMITSVVKDIGKTELDHDTLTCAAVGIYPRKRINLLTEGLKALK